MLPCARTPCRRVQLHAMCERFPNTTTVPDHHLNFGVDPSHTFDTAPTYPFARHCDFPVDTSRLLGQPKLHQLLTVFLHSAGTVTPGVYVNSITTLRKTLTHG